MAVSTSKAPYPIHPLLRLLERIRVERRIPARFFRETAHIRFDGWLRGEFRPRLHTIAEVASLMGYEVVLVDRRTGDVLRPSKEAWARYVREGELHEAGELTVTDLAGGWHSKV